MKAPALPSAFGLQKASAIRAASLKPAVCDEDTYSSPIISNDSDDSDDDDSAVDNNKWYLAARSP
jgi:hypothetical protein